MRRFFFALVFVSLFVSVLMSIPMSRANSSNHSQLTGNVAITMDGLLAVTMGAKDRASVGILDVHHHTPMMKIDKIGSGQRSTLATLTAEQLHGTLSISVEGETPAVSRYLPADAYADPSDFRWNIDMESDLFQRQLYLKESALAGKIHISSGLFYSRNLSEEKYRFFSPDGKSLPFNRQVGEPAATLQLEAGQALTVTGKGVDIRLAEQPGLRYEIAISNEPPPAMANMDHFLYYYTAIGNGNVLPHYQPVMVQKAYYPPPTVCGSIIFSKSTLD